MEDSPPSKRVTVVRRGDDREPARDGISMDGERQH